MTPRIHMIYYVFPYKDYMKRENVIAKLKEISLDSIHTDNLSFIVSNYTTEEVSTAIKDVSHNFLVSNLVKGGDLNGRLPHDVWGWIKANLGRYPNRPLNPGHTEDEGRKLDL